MASSKVTLKDIAQVMGVTTTTVHRALQGKEGVSKETRQEVRKVAVEMGYRSNYMAAALKRKVIRIAVAMPEPTLDNKYYYGNLWLGVRQFLKEAGDFNIEPLEYTYPLAYGANGAALKEIYENHSDNLDGVLTMPVDQGQSSFFIEKFAQKDIPVVLVGSDLFREQRFCCVKTYDEMAGGLAAELLTAFDRDRSPRKVILTGHFGQLGMRDQFYNANGFEAYLRNHAPHIQTMQIHGDDYNIVCRDMELALEQNPDIFAIYSCSARYTVHSANVLDRVNLTAKVKLIGNDCFKESMRLLEQKKLSAIIDKKIPRQTYLAMSILFDYIVKSIYPPSSVMYVRPEVVLQSNMDRELITTDFFQGYTV